MRTITIMALIIGIILIPIACKKDSMRKSEMTNLVEIIKAGATIIDVRTNEEFQQGHAKNSINIPVDSLSENLLKLKKDEAIITVCKSGIRAQRAATILKNNGFNEVYVGGAWSDIDTITVNQVK